MRKTGNALPSFAVDQIRQSPPSKWEVYERWLRVPYYVTFSRYNDELRIFKLSGSS